MKRITKWLLPLVMICTLAGCSTGGTTENTEAASESENTAVVQEANQDYDAVMPILEINTKSQEKNALDFATKPVSRHVSEKIASWTPDYKMPPEPYYEDCVISLKDADEKVLLSGADAQVKVRGNWTTTYDKKALRIKFAEKQNMLGLNDGAAMKNWLLLAEYKDGSMLRNKTAFAIGRELLEEDGLYCSDAEFVEVYINGEYWGVYLLAEYQQINENRVAITEAEKDYTGTDIGYFLEFDGYFYTEDELQQFHVDYADNALLIPSDGNGGSGETVAVLARGKWEYKDDIGFTIKSDIYSEEQRDFIANFVNGAYEIMYEAAYNDKAYEFNADYTELVESSLTPREAVEKVVDVQSLVDLYIISELTCDADIYWSSFFMSADFGADGNKKLTFTAPWDFDSTLGNKDRCADGTGFYASNIVPDVNFQYETANPWLLVLAYEDWYQEMIKEKWTSAYDDGVFERAYEMIENDKTEYAEAFDRNYDKWNNLVNNDSFAGELSHKAAKCKTHEEAADYLREWLESRVEFLNSQWHK
ncbi:MAG: CotH kinase family protein [Oscillospiraceae bacterium]|nr:CotH kinase family protein [Oscillospiraceae bacterium]